MDDTAQTWRTQIPISNLYSKLMSISAPKMIFLTATPIQTIDQTEMLILAIKPVENVKNNKNVKSRD